MTDQTEAPEQKIRVVAIQARELPVKLTDREKLDMGQRLAHLHGELAQHTKHEDDVKASLKATRNSIEAQIGKLATVVRAGEEYRPVDVKVQHDYEKAVYQEIRQDTGDVIAERPLHDHERQVAFLSDYAGRPQLDFTEDPAVKDRKVCKVPGGEYAIEWRAGARVAVWIPEAHGEGGQKVLATGKTAAESIEACGRYELERAADRQLELAGNDDLVDPDAKGEPVTRKKK